MFLGAGCVVIPNGGETERELTEEISTRENYLRRGIGVVELNEVR